jgi:2-iminobutanoate/2-iminopropanoate deaminase
MFRSAIVALALQLPLLVSADGAPETFHLNEKGEKEWNYAQAVRVGNTLYLSGTTGRGATMEEQVRNAYERIQRTLSHFGADFEDVVKETVFTTDLDALKQARDARKAFYGEHMPASSWIGVERLFVPELKIEIEVIAVLGGDK